MNVLYNDEGSLLFTFLIIMPSINISGVEKRIMSPPNTKKVKRNTGSSIKDFEDDSGCAFGDDSSNVIPAKAGIQDEFFVIPHLMRNPRYIPFLLVLKKNKKILDPQSSWG